MVVFLCCCFFCSLHVFQLNGAHMATEPASLENLQVLFHSDDYIVVDKHWDIRIDSKMWYEKLTVQAQLKHHFPQLADHSTYYGFRSDSPCEKSNCSKKKPDGHFSFALTGFVISWISQQVELFVLPSTKLLLAGRTAALRTVASPKPTSPL